MPADTSGTGCLSRGHPGLTLPSRHYRNILKSAPALRRRRHDRLGRYAGYAEAVLFFDDQQAEAGQLCRWRLSSRLSSRSSRGPLYAVVTGATPSARFPCQCTSPPWRCWTAWPAAWLRGPERWPMPAPAGRHGWKQPCLRPRLGIPPCRSSGGGWKTRFISPWQDGILLPIPARGAAG